MLITGERVQLFKSTSKLGDNHHCSHQERERETMTLGLGDVELNMNRDPCAVGGKFFEWLHS